MTETRSFRAFEYQQDTSFAECEMRLSGDTEQGWRIERNGQLWLELGPGYRLLRTRRCGVCSTDLDRHFLPFALPQITGHELVASDEQGRRYVVEINATRASRGVDTDNVWRRAGLDTHDPERIVLGIHDLPGGFSPWILVPVEAALEIPPELPDETAVLAEPFAAVLHGVNMLQLRPGDRVAVLGPRRLGLLAIAALAGARRKTRIAFEIEAWSRHEELGALAVELGADRARLVNPEGTALVDGESAGRRDRQHRQSARTRDSVVPRAARSPSQVHARTSVGRTDAEHRARRRRDPHGSPAP
jgi:threonine dehydrogenase-like Zn-dependent dehydrogenase